jgi:hypothetical protein
MQSLIRAVDEELLRSWAAVTTNLIVFLRSKSLSAYGKLADAMDAMAYDDVDDIEMPVISTDAAPSDIGREVLVGGTGAARGRCQMLPHLLVVGARNSHDPGPAGRGRRLSGEHSGGSGRLIGEEIGMPSSP